MKFNARRKGVGILSDDQTCYLVSGFNFVPVRDMFKTVAEERTAWEAHRDKLMLRQEEYGDFGNYAWGDRPAAWWKFDAPEPRKETEPPLEYLKRHGLLKSGEEAKTRARDARVAALRTG